MRMDNNMTIAKQMDIRKNIKSFFDLAAGGETLFVPRKQNKNVVVISQAEYEDLQKAKRNAEYFAMLDKSYEQFSQGKVVIKTMEELEAMEDE